jgi:hypothetical protein
MKRPPFFVVEYERSWLRRAIRLGGEVDSVLMLDARAIGIGSSEEVLIHVDGAAHSRWRTAPPWERHALSFEVKAWRQSPTIEVQFTSAGMYQIRYFKLSLRGIVLYEEAHDRVLQVLTRPPLPVPASRPNPDREELPIPAEPETSS